MNRRAPRQPLILALMASLVLHLGLLGGLAPQWPTALEVPVPPIEASLLAPAAAPIAPPIPSAPAAAPHRPRLPSRPAPAPPEAPMPEPAAPASEAASLPPAHEPAVPTPAPEPPAPASPPALAEAAAPPIAAPTNAEPAPPARPLRRSLPERLDIRYRVVAGEGNAGGFTLGQAVYTWYVRDGRYSLVSVAEATGLASLFIGGRIVQSSEGRIGPWGLEPEQYWLKRNERRQDVARFDRLNARLILTGSQGGEPLPETTQDLLGFPFHLALTVSDEETEFVLPVTNGRKLKDYTFRNLGREPLELGERTVETLHLQGSRAGEGTLDVWLDIRGTWLPLRVRTMDAKGKVMLLMAEAIGASG